MNKAEYKEALKVKLEEWKMKLAELEDDAERGGEDDEDMLDMKDLFRTFEDIESRLNEIDSMTEEEFDDEKSHIDSLADQLETDLGDARENIKDV